MADVNAKVLVDSLADMPAEVEVITMSETLLKVKAFGQVDVVPDSVAEVEPKTLNELMAEKQSSEIKADSLLATLGDTLAEVEAKTLSMEMEASVYTVAQGET